jgi:(4S)-4-hydroxy-5-phosphonooxypentane-2,3-dione isomerase
MNADNLKHSGKMLFAVTVQFEVLPDRFDEFLLLVNANARHSVELEAGCLQFDVLVPAGGEQPGRVFLYEIYSSAEDFEVHLGMQHFLRFDQATHAMLLSKTVAKHAVFSNTKMSGNQTAG